MVLIQKITRIITHSLISVVHMKLHEIECNFIDTLQSCEFSLVIANLQ